jgi:hypothetical protein
MPGSGDATAPSGNKDGKHEPSGFAAAALGFFLLLLLSSGVMLVGRGIFSSPPTHQPIDFNHRKHVEENGMECVTCHEFFETESFSGLPSAETCSFCHSEAQGDSPEEQKLVRFIQEGRTLDWKPLYRQPPHVFYSHRTHVAVAQLECSTCHGTMGESETPPEYMDPMAMDECIDCHEQRGVATDCTTCHK